MPHLLRPTVLLLLAACTAHAPRAPALWGPLTPGRWAVTVRTLPLPADAAAGRPPLTVTVWAPAASTAGRPALRYRDYVALSGGEAGVEGYRQLLRDNGLSEASVAAWLEAPLAAVRDAPAAGGRHPLVLVAQGRFHSAHHQAVLCEALASHGYVVATTPFPARARPPQTGAEVRADAQAQAEELARALAALRDAPGVDASRVGLVGHSFGARSAFLLALAHPAVRALVSLDGGIANAQGAHWLEGLADFHPGAFRVPLLHLYQPGDGTVTPDLTLLGALRGADRLLVRLAGMRHTDFSSLGAASARVPELAPPGAPAAAAEGYAAAVEATRLFLDAHLAGEPRAREALAHLPGHLGPAGRRAVQSHMEEGAR